MLSSSPPLSPSQTPLDPLPLLEISSVDPEHFHHPRYHPIPPPFDWLRSLFCVDLVNLLQTLGVDVGVCIYDAFMARVVVMLGVGVRVRVRDVGWLCLWLGL